MQTHYKIAEAFTRDESLEDAADNDQRVTTLPLAHSIALGVSSGVPAGASVRGLLAGLGWCPSAVGQRSRRTEVLSAARSWTWRTSSFGTPRVQSRWRPTRCRGTMMIGRLWLGRVTQQRSAVVPEENGAARDGARRRVGTCRHHRRR